MNKSNVNFTSPPQQQLNNLLEHYQNRRFSEAEKLATSITHEFPKHQFAWKVLGAILGQLGKSSEAVKANQAAVSLSPQDYEAHNNLGVTLKTLGRLEEAEASYRKVILLKPDFAEAHYNSGNTLRGLGRLEEAEKSFKQAIKLNPDYAEAHHNLGVTLHDLGRLEESEASYRKVILLKPDHAEAHHNLGATLQDLGRLEESEASYRKVILLKPDFADAHRHLTMTKKFDSMDEQYLKMKELYLNKNISKEQLCHINFALAKACDDLGDFEQAFTHYREGNQLRKNILNYDIGQDIELFNQLKKNYPQIKKNSPELEIFKNKLIPIFIIGIPRSGTTLVEQIISSHSKVEGAGELPFARDFGEGIAQGLSDSNVDRLHEFRKRYLTQLQNFSNNKSIVIDKMPQNFLYIGLLAAVFPKAKIVHVKRNPAAVCWSNYKQYFASKKIRYCYKLDDIIKYYKLYKNLMTFWAEQLPNKIYDIDYELLTVNQENETRKLIDYLGLDWDEKCLSPQDNMRSISSASAIQVRKKIYQGSSHQWKKYKPFLNGKLDYLEKNL
jgi:Flp pilus assembly protein TadD|tara:strand:+ start:114 stop:1778 length:1665 start_codon:yes stop_codon:yes gene_type:complete